MSTSKYRLALLDHRGMVSALLTHDTDVPFEFRAEIVYNNRLFFFGIAYRDDSSIGKDSVDVERHEGDTVLSSTTPFFPEGENTKYLNLTLVFQPTVGKFHIVTDELHFAGELKVKQMEGV